MKRTLITLLSFIMLISIHAQDKKPLDFNSYDEWNYLERSKISNNGQWLVYELNHYTKGDGKLFLKEVSGNNPIIVNRAYNASISPNTNFIVFKIKPEYDTLRTKKLNKVKKDDLPKDSLGIFLINDKSLSKIERVKNFKLAIEESDWFAYQLETELVPDSLKKKKKVKTFDKKAPKTNTLVISNPIDNKTHKFEGVSEYTLSRNGALISFIQLQNDTLLKSTVYSFDIKKEEALVVFEKEGLAKKIVNNQKGNALAFMYTGDTTKHKVYDLYYWANKETSAKVIPLEQFKSQIKEDWWTSANGDIYFSRDDSKLYFGIAEKEKEEPKDTLLEEEKVKLDLWSWTDGQLQPQQLANLKREENRTYLSVFHIKDNKIAFLENETVRDIELIKHNNMDIALGINEQPYLKRRSWDVSPLADYYLVDVKTGKKEKVLTEHHANVSISPEGKFLYWYCGLDSSWYSMSTAAKTIVNLTKEIPVNFYNEEHDYPSIPGSYYYAGWTDGDKYFLVYDKYDIWQLDPTGKAKAFNLTQGFGRKNQIEFKYLWLDRELKSINPKSELLLSAFNDVNKYSGYYTSKVNAKSAPSKLVLEAYRYSRPVKAKDADVITFSKANVSTYPDLWASNLKIENPVLQTNANPQQKDYNWGSVEMVEWTSLEGKTNHGLLYKPENFDPNKKYPVIIYFYRTHSDGLFNHYYPKPSRSTINPIFYVSNEYLVFMPDIHYIDGYPGQSAFKHVVSGAQHLTTFDFVDRENMAIQGQSWGGYQVAYIITQTNMFKCASSGAPVSNMTSAYGGIRWQSGMSRMFQYEQTQSRIGGTLWEKPLRYIENSPVFYADRVNTPVLIRHNDNDGAVPWYQGIEYFVALRRLGKEAWLLNYNGAPHNERNKSPNTYDLSIRMKQFFDHYMKGEPAPKWMTDGIPALKKGKTLGYELNN